MNQYVTGNVIRQLRESNRLTQSELAEKLDLSDKTISKWETGKGYPDISLIEPLTKVFKVSVTELFAGCTVKNKNISANMLRSHFYVCPICGNTIHTMGEAVIHCHGLQLTPCQEEEANETHSINIKIIEDEYFVQILHEMKKEHYISFIAALSYDKIQLIKLYPEGNAETRFKINGIKKIVYYCNRDGLFSVNLKKNNHSAIHL